MKREWFFIVVAILLLLQHGLQGCALVEYVSQQVRYDDPYADQTYLAPDDIVLGMNMHDVISAWGEPGEVQNAGNTTSTGNQRWVYPIGQASRLYSGENRVVYFENGRVVGWEASPTL